MGIYLDFPRGWWLILAIIYLPYLLLFIHRESHKKKDEIRNQLFVGLIMTFIAVVVEFVAVSFSVWTYFPDNWPIALWPSYFGSGLLAYQIIKLIEKK